MNSFKKTLRTIVTFLFIFIISLGTTIQAVSANSIRVAKISELSGEVNVVKAGGEKSFAAFKGMGLTQGDTIITKKDAWVRVALDVDKEIKIAANTKIMIKELTASLASESSKFQLWAGGVWSDVKKELNADSKFEIHTPTAVMGVRGTQFAIWQSNIGTDVNVFDGEVEAAIIASGLSASVEKNQSLSLQPLDEEQTLQPQPIQLQNLNLFMLETLREQLERTPEDIDPTLGEGLDEAIEQRRIEENKLEEERLKDMEQPPKNMIEDTGSTENTSSTTGGGSSAGGGDSSGGGTITDPFKAEVLPVKTDSKLIVIRFNHQLHDDTLKISQVSDMISELYVQTGEADQYITPEDMSWNTAENTSDKPLLMIKVSDSFNFQEGILHITIKDGVIKDKDNNLLTTLELQESVFDLDIYAYMLPSNGSFPYESNVVDEGLEMDIYLLDYYEEHNWVSDIDTNSQKAKELINGFFTNVEQEMWEKVRKAAIDKIDSNVGDVIKRVDDNEIQLKLPPVSDYNISEVQVIQLIIPKSALQDGIKEVVVFTEFPIINTIEEYAFLETKGLNPKHDLNTPAYIMTNGLNPTTDLSGMMSTYIPLQFTVCDDVYTTNESITNVFGDNKTTNDVLEFIRNAKDVNGNLLGNRIEIETYRLNGNDEIAFKVLETGTDTSISFSILGTYTTDDMERIEEALGMKDGTESHSDRISDDTRMCFKINNTEYYLYGDVLKQSVFTPSSTAETIRAAILNAESSSGDSNLSDVATVVVEDGEIVIRVERNDDYPLPMIGWSVIHQDASIIDYLILREAFGL